MIFSLRLFDREIVDGSVAKPHQAMIIKLPVLIAIGAEPIPGVIVPFVGEAHRDAIFGVTPKFFNKPIVHLLRPLTL